MGTEVAQPGAVPLLRGPRLVLVGELGAVAVAGDQPEPRLFAVVGLSAVRPHDQRARLVGRRHERVEGERVADGPRRHHRHRGDERRARQRDPLPERSPLLGERQRRGEREDEEDTLAPSERGHPHHPAEQQPPAQLRRVSHAVGDEEDQRDQESVEGLGHQRAVGQEQRRVHRRDPRRHPPRGGAPDLPPEQADEHHRSGADDRHHQSLGEVRREADDVEEREPQREHRRLLGRRQCLSRRLEMLGPHEAVAVGDVGGEPVIRVCVTEQTHVVRDHHIGHPNEKRDRRDREETLRERGLGYRSTAAAASGHADMMPGHTPSAFGQIEQGGI